MTTMLFFSFFSFFSFLFSSSSSLHELIVHLHPSTTRAHGTSYSLSSSKHHLRSSGPSRLTSHGLRTMVVLPPTPRSLQHDNSSPFLGGLPPNRQPFGRPPPHWRQPCDPPTRRQGQSCLWCCWDPPASDEAKDEQRPDPAVGYS